VTGTPNDGSRVRLSRILRLFKPYRVRLCVVLLLIVVSALLALVPPFLLRAILDVALPRGRTGLLTVLAAGMLALVAASSALGVWQSYLSLIVGQDVTNDLRNAVYAHLQRMSLAYFTGSRTGEVLSRIGNDIGGVSATVTSTATTVVGSATTAVGSLAAMIGLDWRLSIVSLLMLPLFVLISRKVGDERRAISLRRQQQLAVMSTMVEESLSVSGFLLGRVLGRSQTLNEEFARQSRALTGLTIASAMAGRWRQSTIQLIMAAMPVMIFWAAGMTADHGHLVISIGTLIAFTSLQQGLFSPSVQLLQTGIVVQSSLALFERIFDYLDLPIDIREPTRPVPLPEPQGHVRFERVGFRYGDRQVLYDIDIDIPPGRHLAVVGATGAGKTSLGYLVPRLYDVTAGRITIDGVDVRELTFATLAASVGVVSQDTYLFHTTIAGNLRFAKPDATDDELVAAAKAAQIHRLISALPDGYDTIVGERGHRFSGGEKQRLAIARTILRDPPVLILDEATSSLDSRTEHAVQRALDALAAGRTTITITHRLPTIRGANEIIVLDHGRIVERGTHAELLALNGYYAAHVGRAEPDRPAIIASAPTGSAVSPGRNHDEPA
jgi:ATP-binding cassette, subfamily B, bacterial